VGTRLLISPKSIHYLSRGESLTQPERESGMGLAFETVFPKGFPRLCTCNQSFSVGLFLFNAQALPEGRGKSELFPIRSPEASKSNSQARGVAYEWSK